MIKWIVGWMDREMDRCREDRMDVNIDNLMDRQVHLNMDRWMDTEMYISMDKWLTFIRPVWYSIENLIDFSIISNLYWLSSSIWLNINIIIPHICLKKR